MSTAFVFNIHSVGPFMAAFLSLASGVFLSVLIKRKPLNILFFLLYIFAFMFFGAWGFMLCAKHPAYIYILGETALIFITLFSATVYSVADAFVSGNIKHKKTCFFVYGFSFGIMGGLAVFGFFNGIQVPGYGFVPKAGMTVYVLLIFIIACFVLSLLNIIRQHINTKDVFCKKITLYFFAAVFMGQFCIFDLLTMFNAHIYPVGWVFLGVSLMCIFFLKILDIHHEYEQFLSKNNQLMKELRTTQLMVMESGKISALASISAGLLHQMSQPVTAIHGFAKFLKSEMKSGDPFYRPVSLIAEQASHIKAMLGNLMELVYHKETKKEKIDVNDILRKVMDMLQDQLRIRHIIWDLQLCEAKAVVFADQVHLQQAFLNILTNAMQAVESLASDKERQINIKTHIEDGKNVKISFQDNGPGIVPLHQMRIFEPFFTTKEKSAGMGLALTKDIIEEIQGKVVLEPTEEGACFDIYLPLVF